MVFGGEKCNGKWRSHERKVVRCAASSHRDIAPPERKRGRKLSSSAKKGASKHLGKGGKAPPVSAWILRIKGEGGEGGPAQLGCKPLHRGKGGSALRYW